MQQDRDISKRLNLRVFIRLTKLCKPYKRVGIYAANDVEIDVSKLLSWGRITGKNLYYPVVTNAKGGKMDFFLVDTRLQLSSGYKSIIEPKLSVFKQLAGRSHSMYERARTTKDSWRFSAPELLIVPGLAFDKQGYRLGYGGGFYDRYLARYPQVKTIGVCRRSQIVSGRLPIETFDRPMDKVICV